MNYKFHNISYPDDGEIKRLVNSTRVATEVATEKIDENFMRLHLYYALNYSIINHHFIGKQGVIFLILQTKNTLFNTRKKDRKVTYGFLFWKCAWPMRPQ